MVKKIWKKGLAFLIAAGMLTGVPAMALETDLTQVDVETTAGRMEQVDVAVRTEEILQADGTLVKLEEAAAEDFLTENGLLVDYEGTGKTDENGMLIEEQTAYTSEKDNYTAEGGSRISTEEQTLSLTVDVPLTEGDSDTAEGAEAGTVLHTEGDVKTSPEDGTYDFKQTVVEKQGSTTVTTEEISATENILPKEESQTDLEYIRSETAAAGEKDLFIWVFRGNRTQLPEEGQEIETAEGFDYRYLGIGNTSQVLPSFVYTSPDPENPHEEPAYVDAEGNAYYLRGRNGVDMNRVYHDGEGVAVEDGYQSVFTVPQQFVLVDVATGEVITTYCADADTDTVQGYNYNVENLEDADYYDDQQAAMIRTIAENGYWGTVGTEVDENGNTVPVQGSLEAMKQHLLASGEFTEEELEALTDGVALSATQMAIWKYSNAMNGMEFVNAVHAKDSNADNEIATNWAGQLLRSDADALSEEEQKSVDLLYKLYDYMIGMEPTIVEQPTTQDTIINADNFLKDLSVTVVEKAEDHENNRDQDDANDAYVTDLTFALVVTPSTENGDDLTVKVIDAAGNAIAEGRIAGQVKDNEQMLYADADGNYTFSGITMVEGDQNFNITLEGVQNLQEGVYLYTSEIRTDDAGEEQSSQTMVGLAKGRRDVSVEMNIRFELDVEEEIVAHESCWRIERIGGNTPVGNIPDDDTPEEVIPDEEVPLEELPDEEVPAEETPQEEIPAEEPPVEEIPVEELPEEEVPLEELPEEDVPMAEVPQTGDSSALWAAVALLSGLGLILVGRKRKDV